MSNIKKRHLQSFCPSCGVRNVLISELLKTVLCSKARYLPLLGSFPPLLLALVATYSRQERDYCWLNELSRLHLLRGEKHSWKCQPLSDIVRTIPVKSRFKFRQCSFELKCTEMNTDFKRLLLRNRYANQSKLQSKSSGVEGNCRGHVANSVSITCHFLIDSKE